MNDILLSPLPLEAFRQLLREEIQTSIAQIQLTPQPAQQPQELGGIELAEEVTGLRKQTIYGLVSARKIPFMKRGKRLYFQRAELIAWIKEGKQKTVKEIEAEAEAFISTKGPKA